jgi:non-heme chloroperoxidase
MGKRGHSNVWMVGEHAVDAERAERGVPGGGIAVARIGGAPTKLRWKKRVLAAKRPGMIVAGKSIGQVADQFEPIIRGLTRKPAIIGHSFGGLLTQILAGRGLAVGSVAIDPAPFRGVLPLPMSSLKSAFPVLGNPANRNRAVPLTYEQFCYAFANAVSEDEAKELYETFAVPTSGKPLFQAAAANLNPWTEAKVDTENPARGPLLIISGEKDNTVPWAIANASYKQQQDNPGVTEFVEIKGRGHALTIDSGWREVADTRPRVRQTLHAADRLTASGPSRGQLGIGGPSTAQCQRWCSTGSATRGGSLTGAFIRTEARTPPAASRDAQTHMAVW